MVVICRGEWLMDYWERRGWFKSKEQKKGKVTPKITLVKK